MSKIREIPMNQSNLNEFIIKIKVWWFLLLAKWWQILIIGFVGGILGFFYAYLQHPKYISKLTFVVEDGKTGPSSLGGLASLAGQFGVDVGNMSGNGLFSGENILLYLKSPSLSREVLVTKYRNSNETLADEYSRVYHLKEKWAKNPKIGYVNFPYNKKDAGFTRLQDSLLQSISEYIIKKEFTVIKTDKKASFIDVVVTMENESLSKIYCERLVELAVKKYVDIKTKRQKSTVNNLQFRVDSIYDLLQRKTVIGASLQTNSNIMDINPLYKTKTSISSETTVRDKTMLATIYASATQNLEMAKFTLSQETPVIQIVDAPILPLKMEKMSKIKTALLSSIFLSFMFITFVIGLSEVYQVIKNESSSIADSI